MSPHWPNNKLCTVSEDKPVMEDNAGHTDNLLTYMAIDPSTVYFDDDTDVFTVRNTMQYWAAVRNKSPRRKFTPKMAFQFWSTSM